jgi:hypothetical protein
MQTEETQKMSNPYSNLYPILPGDRVYYVKGHTLFRGFARIKIHVPEELREEDLKYLIKTTHQRVSIWAGIEQIERSRHVI